MRSDEHAKAAASTWGNSLGHRSLLFSRGRRCRFTRCRRCNGVGLMLLLLLLLVAGLVVVVVVGGTVVVVVAVDVVVDFLVIPDVQELRC